MEGPSIVLLREEAAKFVGRRILKSQGNSQKVPPASLGGKIVRSLSSWGKILFVDLGKTKLKVHFLLFGSYRIDEKKANASPRLALRFANGSWYFYSCSITFIEASEIQKYDPRVDLMSDDWDASLVRRLMKGHEDELVCDVLLNQSIFSGLGNIIKNEVLFLMGLSPQTRLKELSPRDKTLLVKCAYEYSRQFYEWKKAHVLRKNWKVMRRGYCAACGTKIESGSTGVLQRRTFWCPQCQNR